MPVLIPACLVSILLPVYPYLKQTFAENFHLLSVVFWRVEIRKLNIVFA